MLRELFNRKLWAESCFYTRLSLCKEDWKITVEIRPFIVGPHENVESLEGTAEKQSVCPHLV